MTHPRSWTSGGCTNGVGGSGGTGAVVVADEARPAADAVDASPVYPLPAPTTKPRPAMTLATDRAPTGATYPSVGVRRHRPVTPSSAQQTLPGPAMPCLRDLCSYVTFASVAWGGG